MSFRDNRFSDVKVPLAWVATLALIAAVVLAIAFLVSDRRETLEAQAYGTVKSTLDMVQTPVSDALSTPARWTESGLTGIRGYFFAVSENRKLRKENEELRRWRDAAIALKDVNARYQAILGLKIEPPIPEVTGRSVTDSRGPFANSRLVNVGREKGVKVGNPVMSENGLVGRVIGVTHGASRILLLTDNVSRMPVMIDRTNARATLLGDGGPNPKLAYLRGRDPVKAGDRVLTSGDGGVVPRGLPVGVAVKGLDGAWRVHLASDYAPIDFVRILKFEDFAQIANQQELSASAMPPPTPGMAPLVPPVLPGATAPAAAPAAPAPALKATPVAPPAVRPATPLAKAPAQARPPARPAPKANVYAPVTPPTVTLSPPQPPQPVAAPPAPPSSSIPF